MMIRITSSSLPLRLESGVVVEKLVGGERELEALEDRLETDEREEFPEL